MHQYLEISACICLSTILLPYCSLALARVSVLRGSGPSAGVAFIDDYVAAAEPVVDYLTRWSGIRPGWLALHQAV